MTWENVQVFDISSTQDDKGHTESVFAGDYYMTGDRAYMDDDDYVWFVGRADDVILSSG